MALFGAIRIVERRGSSRVRRLVEFSRHPRTLQAAGGLVVLVVLAATIAVGGRAWHRFSSNDIQFPTTPQQHFGQLSGAGRHELWRVALDSFASKPILGHGAGSYESQWDQHRKIPMVVKDAHSLYLESLAELGVVGGAIVLLMVGGILWCGFSAWRHGAGDSAERSAALLAAALAFSASAAFDWSWEMAGLGAIFFLAGGVLVGERCTQLALGEARSTETAPEGRPFGFALGGLAVAFASVVLLAGPYLVEREIHESQHAAAAGDLVTAADHASTARSIEPWASTPYVQLGLLAELQGDYAGAQSRLTQAIDRDEHNYVLYELRARVDQEAGDHAAAAADRRKAKELNPLAG